MQILSLNDPHAISLACQALSRGELIIYPTETCYGLGADCSNPTAVTRLLNYKGDRHRQVAVAVASRAMAEQFVKLNPIADNLYIHFLPGPITVISQSKHRVDERLESSAGTLGIRLPNFSPTLALLRQFGRPISATSANTSGKKEPYSFSDWQKYTAPSRQSLISLFLDAGPLANRPTSTVVDTTLNAPQILRQGQLIIPTLSPSLISHSTEETQQFAQTILSSHLALTRRFPLILALQGELGVGKTQFCKGLAAKLGIHSLLSSPTYTLLKEYPFKLPKYQGILYHIDTWRLPDATELESTLHFSQLLKPGNILAIEWAGKAKKILQPYEKNIPILVINIKELTENTRQITYAFSTPEWN